MLGKRVAALSWSQLSPLAARWSAPPGEAGPTSAQSRLRLFGAKESDVRVTLYRDNHAWCASANTMCTVEQRELRLVCRLPSPTRSVQVPVLPEVLAVA